MKYLLLEQMRDGHYVHAATICETKWQAQAEANLCAATALDWEGKGFWDGQMSLDYTYPEGYDVVFTIVRVYTPDE